ERRQRPGPVLRPIDADGASHLAWHHWRLQLDVQRLYHPADTLLEPHQPVHRLLQPVRAGADLAAVAAEPQAFAGTQRSLANRPGRFARLRSPGPDHKVFHSGLRFAEGAVSV